MEECTCQEGYIFSCQVHGVKRLPCPPVLDWDSLKIDDAARGNGGSVTTLGKCEHCRTIGMVTCPDHKHMNYFPVISESNTVDDEAEERLP